MKYPVRIQWEDVDYAEVIFWPRCFAIVDRGMSEWLLSKGLSWVELNDRRNVGLPIVSVGADFYKPLGLQEEAILELGLCDLTAQGCCFIFNLRRCAEEGGGELIASGYIRRRFVDRDRFVACNISDDLLAIFAEMRDESREVRCVLRTNGRPSMTLARNSGVPAK